MLQQGNREMEVVQEKPISSIIYESSCMKRLFKVVIRNFEEDTYTGAPLWNLIFLDSLDREARPFDHVKQYLYKSYSEVACLPLFLPLECASSILSNLKSHEMCDL